MKYFIFIISIFVLLTIPTAVFAQQGVPGASCTPESTGSPTANCSGTVATTPYVIPSQCRSAAPSATTPCSKFWGSYADPTTPHIGEVYTQIFKQTDGTYIVQFNSASITLTADGRIIKDTTASQDAPNNPHMCDTGGRPYYEVLGSDGRQGMPFVPPSMTCGKDVASTGTLVAHSQDGKTCDTAYDGPIGTTRQLIYQGPGTCNGKPVSDAIVVASTGGAGAGEVYVYCKGLGLCAVYGQMGSPDASGWGAGTDLCALPIQSACTIPGAGGNTGDTARKIVTTQTFTGKTAPPMPIHTFDDPSWQTKWKEVNGNFKNAFNPNDGTAFIGGREVEGAKLIPGALKNKVKYTIGDLREYGAIGGFTQSVSGGSSTPCEFSDEATQTEALPIEYGKTVAHIADTLSSIVTTTNATNLDHNITKAHVVDPKGSGFILTPEYKAKLFPCGADDPGKKVEGQRVSSQGSILGSVVSFLKGIIDSILSFLTSEEKTVTTTQTLTNFTDRLGDLADRSIGAANGAFNAFRPSSVKISGTDACTNANSEGCPENTTKSVPHFQGQAIENAYNKTTKCLFIPKSLQAKFQKESGDDYDCKADIKKQSPVPATNRQVPPPSGPTPTPSGPAKQYLFEPVCNGQLCYEYFINQLLQTPQCKGQYLNPYVAIAIALNETGGLVSTRSDGANIKHFGCDDKGLLGIAPDPVSKFNCMVETLAEGCIEGKSDAENLGPGKDGYGYASGANLNAIIEVLRGTTTCFESYCFPLFVSQQDAQRAATSLRSLLPTQRGLWAAYYRGYIRTFTGDPLSP